MTHGDPSTNWSRPTTPTQAPESTTSHEYHYHYNSSTYIDADFALISEDNIHFCVHRSTLRAASSHFKEWLDGDSAKLEGKSANAQVVLNIPSSILSYLLDFVYVQGLPDIEEFGEFYDVCIAAEELRMTGVLASLSKYVILLDQKHTYPSVPLYALARRMEWEDVEKLAAKKSLKSSVWEIVSLQGVGTLKRCLTVSTLVRLQDWHVQRIRMVSDALDDIGTLGQLGVLRFPSFDWKALHKCSHRFGSCKCVERFQQMASDRKERFAGAIQSFKAVVRMEMETQPGLSSFSQAVPCASDNGGWWVFEGITCSDCGYGMFDRDLLRNALNAFVTTLPQYPGDSQKPTKKRYTS